MPHKALKSKEIQPETPCHDASVHGNPASRPLLIRRLARIEGQVRGLSRMVEEGRYCIDILTQIAAVHQALRATGRQILEDHMKSCVAGAMQSGDPAEADRVSAEIGDLMGRLS